MKFCTACLSYFFTLCYINLPSPAAANSHGDTQTVDPSACSDHLLICELDRFQTLVSAMFVLIAALIAFRGAIKSARMESEAALTSAKLSAEAAAAANKETLAQNLSSLERQFDEDRRRKQETLQGNSNRFVSFLRSTVSQSLQELQELCDDCKHHQEFQKPTDIVEMRDTISSIIDQFAEVQNLSLDYSISADIRKNVAEVRISMRKSVRTWIREFGETNVRQVSLPAENPFMISVYATKSKLEKLNADLDKLDGRD